MGRKPHVMIVSYPAQGHVKPLMKLAQKIASHDSGIIKVTFVNTEFIHGKVVSAAVLPEIALATIPDGLEPDDDRNDFSKLAESMERVMPAHLADLIHKINSEAAAPGDEEGDERLTFMIFDACLGWIMNVGREMGIQRVAVWVAGPGTMALLLHAPKLMEAGVIDIDGFRMKNELIKLAEDIPPWKCNEVTWSYPNKPELERAVFKFTRKIQQCVESADLVITNIFYELDSKSCDLIPNILPFGPWLLNDQLDQSAGSLWLEDSDCLTWLDQQTPNSVIYAAFGSHAVFSSEQFIELALGLELSGRPFLWVVDVENKLI